MTDREQVRRDAETWAQKFHETYEALAPSFSYETREASAVPWVDVPELNRALMIATVDVVLDDLLAELEQAERERDEARRTADRWKSENTIIREANERFGSTNEDLVEELNACKSRLARVPALVEAIAEASTSLNTGPAKDGYAYSLLSEAIAAWEEE